jgi:hypothetical protein
VIYVKIININIIKWALSMEKNRGIIRVLEQPKQTRKARK